MYVTPQYKSRLGTLTSDKVRYNRYGDLGQDSATSIINAIGNVVLGVTGIITKGRVDTVAITADKDKFMTAQIEASRRLDITTKGEVAKAQTESENIKTKYTNLSSIILSAGGVLALILIAGGFSYGMATKK